MRIGIDLRCLEEEQISGVGEYALELLKKLIETDGKNRYVIFSNSFKQKNNRHFEKLKIYPNAELKRFRRPNKWLNFSLWYFGRPKLDKFIGGVDVFFAPNINFLAVRPECKFISTFHDLSFERSSEFFALKARLWHQFFVNPRRIAKISTRVIAVSESTKRDLAEIYGINQEKISVIRHGMSGDYAVIDRNNPKLLAIQKKYGLPHKFILYLGNIEPRKNVASLIEAHKKMQTGNLKFEKYKLVLAGKVHPLCRALIEKEKNCVRAIGYVDREDKPAIYNLASLFVFPSHFEGFGLPVLEAMACGTPVICSNNSSFPEVAENAAILIDPNRPQEIAEAMAAILADEKTYAKMRDRGLKQAKKFSWRKCAEETLAIIQK